jgi:hypothetical protein
MARKTEFNVEDAEILLQYLQHFHEVLQQEWLEVKTQWGCLQQTWHDQQFDAYEPLHEALLSTYDNADMVCEGYIAFLEEIIASAKNAKLGELISIALSVSNGLLNSNAATGKGSSSTASNLNKEELADLKNFFADETGVFEDVKRHEKEWESRFKKPELVPPPPPPSALELGAVTAYSGNTFECVNKFLRGNRGSSENEEAVLNFTKLLNSALVQLPKCEMTVYRGVSSNLSKDQIEQYIPGQTITEPSFTSTSTSETEAFDPKCFGKGNARFIILSKTGRSIRDFSAVCKEDEVLFAANTQFRVIERYQNKENHKTIILMEDVSSEF